MQIGSNIYKVFKRFLGSMKEQENQGYEHTFMSYPKHTKEMVTEFRKEKSLQGIQDQPDKNKDFEFDTLCDADIPQSAFCLKKQKMDRYSDIWAYQHSRIKLPQVGPDYYINGNEVKSLVDNQIFCIFSQAPVAPFDNFWEAAYYKDVKLVVMLCMFVDPRRGRQSEPYWPGEGKSAYFSSGKLKVTNGGHKTHDEQFIETEYTVEGPEGVRTIKHYHWMGWSDLKKPVDHKMERFEHLIETCLELIKKKEMIWIHCSAGIGRTGTLGGILEAIRLYEKDRKISIFKIVENMRKYRFHAVQTEEQYRFLYSYLGKRLEDL